MVKKWLNNKTFLRILSLVIAFALWSYVIITQDPVRTARIDNVEVICGLSQAQLNEGLSVISKSHETVSVTATGKRSLVNSRAKYYAKLNLDNITSPGKYSIAPDFSIPGDVTVNSTTPTVVDVYIDRYVSSLIPVKVNTIGELPEGLSLKSALPDISVTTVTVPSLLLEEISYVGAVVDLSQVTASGRIDCPVVLCDMNDHMIDMSGATIEAQTINIDIEIERVKNVPIHPSISDDGSFTSGLTMNVNPKTIDIYGSADAVNAVSSLSTDTLRLFSIPSSNDEFHVKLQFPVGIHLAEDASDTVTITYK